MAIPKNLEQTKLLMWLLSYGELALGVSPHPEAMPHDADEEMREEGMSSWVFDIHGRPRPHGDLYQLVLWPLAHYASMDVSVKVSVFLSRDTYNGVRGEPVWVGDPDIDNSTSKDWIRQVMEFLHARCDVDYRSVTDDEIVAHATKLIAANG
jgi:hypothetical protein